MRDYEAVLKQARTCANRKYCDIGGNCEYYDAGVCCQGGEKDILNDAADAIEELGAAVPKWISVEERLPGKDNMVFVYYEWTGQSGTVYKEVSLSTLGEIQHFGFKPIAWMPLPSAPKEET